MRQLRQDKRDGLIDDDIYKTKNMLSIIPLNILSNQNGVSELLRINKSEKK